MKIHNLKRTWNRTKIVCTIGPASSNRDVLTRMVEAGMDVARLNFSHGDYENHRECIKMIREVADEKGVAISILQDLQGPRIRIGKFKGGRAELRRGEKFLITIRQVEGNEHMVSTHYRGIVNDLRRGDMVLLADGRIELKVVKVTDEDVVTEVVNGGVISNYKGMNIPDVSLGIKSITEKDREDIKFGVSQQVDYIAVSFVRSAEDVIEAKRVVDECGGDIPVIAKIERREAIEALDKIMDVADGVMVARGDLGVQLPLERVPLLQKKIIAEAERFGIPVITATQMLASMVASPRPTRAEASDVANAILDGSDCIMLSEETATGSYPVEAVLFMSKIADEVEGEIVARISRYEGGGKYGNPLAKAIFEAARDCKAKLICVFTRSGATALFVSKSKPPSPIIAMTPFEKTYRRMPLLWGVEPVKIENFTTVAEAMEVADRILRARGLVGDGDKIVIVGGYPPDKRLHSNLLLIYEIGSLAR